MQIDGATMTARHYRCLFQAARYVRQITEDTPAYNNSEAMQAPEGNGVSRSKTKDIMPIATAEWI
jgi:hypothetical protein